MSSDKQAHLFKELVAIVEKLRSEDGCPWDREQSLEDWISYLLEEAEELAEAAEKKKAQDLKEELGDVLYLVVMIAQVARERKMFSLEEVIEGAVKKMKRRHPHVFGDATAKNASDALKLFYEAKENEKKLKNEQTI